MADVIADWKKTPGAVGIRIMLPKEAGRAADDPGLDRILRAAVRYDLPVNILFWGNLDVGTALIDRHPDTRFIIDHLGIMQPRVPPAPPQPWADLPKVLELAKRPNAVIKVSGACTLSQQPYPFPDIWDPLARVFDAWGFERCLWGTDWTRAFAVVNYEQAVEPFLQHRPPERHRAGHADGRRLRQGLSLVAAKSLVHPLCGTAQSAAQVGGIAAARCSARSATDSALGSSRDTLPAEPNLNRYQAAPAPLTDASTRAISSAVRGPASAAATQSANSWRFFTPSTNVSTSSANA